MDNTINEPSLEELLGYIDSPRDSFSSQDSSFDISSDPLADEVTPPEEEDFQENFEGEIDTDITPTEIHNDPIEGDVSSAETPYTEYFNLLKENNLLHVNEDFTFDGTVLGLENAIIQTKENLQGAVAQALWEKLPEDFRPLLEYAIQGGTDVQAFLNTFQSNDLSNIELEGNTENQREVLKRYFSTTTKYDTDKINRMVERLYMTGEMETEAVSALAELKEIEQSSRFELVETQKKQKEEYEQQQKQFREDISSLIGGSSYIEPPRQNKVRSFLFNVSSVSGDTDTQFNRTLKNIAANKEHLVQLADILLDYDPKTGIKLDRIQRKESTKATQSLRQKLEEITSNTKTKVTGASSKTDTNRFDWEQFLNQN